MANSVYKLTYFNVRARGEPIRFIFAVAGVPYEDRRIEKADWPALKQTFPWGKIPVLEVDGESLAESTAICRFLAKRFKLTGSNELEAAKCDEYVDAMMDTRAQWKAFYFEADESKKAEMKKKFLETDVPNCFSRFEKILEKSGGDYLLGGKVCWADLHIAHTLAFYETTVDPGVMKGYPKLLKFKEAVFNIPEIKEWVEKRPENSM